MLSFLNARLYVLILVISIGSIGSLAKTFDIFSSSVLALESILGGDIVLHFVISFLLGFTAVWVTPSNYRSNPLPITNHLVLFVLVLVSIDELLQLFSLSRQFSFDDMLTNTLGIIGGAIFMNFLILLKKLHL